MYACTRIDLSHATAVYLATVLQYVATEVLNIAGKLARTEEQPVRPCHMDRAIQADEELRHLFRECEIVEGGGALEVLAPLLKAPPRKRTPTPKVLAAHWGSDDDLKWNQEGDETLWGAYVSGHRRAGEKLAPELEPEERYQEGPSSCWKGLAQLVSFQRLLPTLEGDELSEARRFMPHHEKALSELWCAYMCKKRKQDEERQIVRMAADRQQEIAWIQTKQMMGIDLCDHDPREEALAIEMAELQAQRVQKARPNPNPNPNPTPNP